MLMHLQIIQTFGFPFHLVRNVSGDHLNKDERILLRKGFNSDRTKHLCTTWARLSLKVTLIVLACFASSR